MNNQPLVIDELRLSMLNLIHGNGIIRREILAESANQCVDLCGLDRNSDSYEADTIRDIVLEGITVDEALIRIANHRIAEMHRKNEEMNHE